MPLFPLVHRDLRARASRSVTYWQRFGVVGAGILALLLSRLEWDLSAVATEDGIEMFNDLVVAAFLVGCGSLLLTVEALQTERREGTLELLFLTRVGPLDILLGKLASCGLSAMVGLLAFAPMLMIPVLMGGVSGGEVLRKALGLLVLLLLALVIGLRSSVSCPDRFSAIRNACIWLAVLGIVPWLTAFFLRSAPLGMPSPVVTLLCASADEYQSQPHYYWVSLATVLGVAGLLFLQAVLRFKQVSEPIPVAAQPTLTDRTSEAAGNHSTDALADPFARSHDPIGWWVRRQPRVQHLLVWASAVVILHVAFDWFGIYHSPAQIFFWCGWFVSSSLWLGLLGVAAGRFFYTAKQSGELELLATTPLGPREITLQQWHGLKSLMKWPVMLAILAFLFHRVLIELLVWSGSLKDAWSEPVFPVIYLLSWLLEVLFTLFEVAAIAWVGMWAALKGRSQLGIAGCCALAGIVPSIVLYLSAWYLVWQPLLRSAGAYDASLWIVQDTIEQTVLMVYYVVLYFFLRRRLLRQWPTR